MYQFSKKKKNIIISIMFLGFFILFLDQRFSLDKIFMKDLKKETKFFLKKTKNNTQNKDKYEKKENRLWVSLYLSIFYFFTVSLGSLFFLGIQHISKSGWSIILHPIMEEISSFLPYGGLMIMVILSLNYIGIIHIFKWMDPLLNDHKIIGNKKYFLNIPFFLIRSLIYITGWSFFSFQMKKISSFFQNSFSEKNYKKLYSLSVKFIIFFSITSIFMGWDWVMSLNIHWFSTLYSWYILSSYLVTGISTITIVSIYLKIKGCLPFFNENHLHDLSKYLFSSSLLWTYLWFSQFLLYWYGNIPEEISFFIKREDIYGSIHFWMLIFNFIIPFLGLMSSKNKINSNIVFTISSILLIGHYIDIYHLIYPEIIYSNLKPKFGLSEIGSLLLIGSIFSYKLLFNLNKRNIHPIGHPFFQESKKYKYPYI
ncbi:hypothetical protein [Blattabacterium cuenoti]|uniref:hypothetical protein n=1 Tax=Blattabacterium cuenoti TaxID=1653831 RepID=UPI00163D3C9B|nr:hypothetical protein [Blattabacterium cuenoti]